MSDGSAAKVQIGTYIAWLNQQGVSCQFGTSRSPAGTTYELYKLSKDGKEYVLTGASQTERMHPLTVAQCDRVLGIKSQWGEGY
jgi:hypothetical protein